MVFWIVLRSPILFRTKAPSKIIDKLKVFLQSVIANLLISVRGKNSRSNKFAEDKLIIIIENPRTMIHFMEFLVPL